MDVKFGDQRREMFIDPDMGRRAPPKDDIPWGTVALVLAIATILILLIGCQMPLR